jgi:beta-galactosidase
MPHRPSRRAFLSEGAVLAAAGGIALPAAGRAESAQPPPRERLSFDIGWRFHEGDIPFPPLLDHEASYAHAKAGNAEGAAADAFDDSGWQSVRLPHDWAVAQPFDRTANIDQGYRRRGIGWYRRSFALELADRGRALTLCFDGIATHATIWINGTLAHRQFGGSTGFTIDLTPFARFGDDLNTIAIRVDADASEGWWYEGAGLYRHAWLLKRAPVHIAVDGVHAAPRRAESGGWTVPVALTLANQGAATSVQIEALLLDGDTVVARALGTAALTAQAEAPAKLALAIAAPRLWSPDSPTLYTLRTRLLGPAGVLDAVDTAIGFRTLRFDADHGFFLNDVPLKIRGTCAHQDHAGIGVAVPDSLWDFRLRRIKAMGANALRTAHNPPAPELLDAADRLGVLVLNEYRELSAAADTLDRLASFVRRDRNHPSVFLWSLCNEESLQSSAIGVAMFARMRAVVRALDPGRPITAALNGAMFAKPNIADQLDVVGFNYGTAQLDRFHAAHPTMPLLVSEDTSAFATRGAARTDRAAQILADDDSEHAAWGSTHRAAWATVAARPFVTGSFFWTAFDYRGEPTPFEWPSVASFFGAMDQCGFAKAAFHIRRALWSAAPVLQLWQHWTWPGHEGQPVPLSVIANADRVELRLNGRAVADLDLHRDVLARTTLPYAPGILEALAYRGDTIVARQRLETAGPPVALRLTPDRPRILGDGRDAVPVTVEAVDAQGRAVPIADTDFTLSVQGGAILGTGNGDPNRHAPETPAACALFAGLAQTIVRSDGAPALRLTATAPGLRPAILHLPAIRHEIAAVPAIDGRQQLTEWRVAPAAATPPDLARRIAPGDMNSWAWLKPGAVERGDPARRWVLFQLAFTPRDQAAQRGGTIVFAALAGTVRLWLDGRLVAEKSDPAPTRFAVPLPPGRGERLLQLLFDTGGRDAPFGLAGSVAILPASLS